MSEHNPELTQEIASVLEQHAQEPVEAVAEAVAAAVARFERG